MLILTNIPQNRLEDVTQEIISDDEAKLILDAIGQAEKDIAEINQTLDVGIERAEEFFKQMQKLRGKA
jgi:CHASE3 domain sensor protein